MYKQAQPNPPNRVLIFIVAIAYLVMAMMLASCSSQKRMGRLMEQNPGPASAKCEEMFPVIEKSDTVYVDPDSSLIANYERSFSEYSEIIDSLLSVRCPDAKLEVIGTLKEIPGKPVVKIVTKTVESTARLRAFQDSCEFMIHELELKMNGLKSQIATAKKKQEKAEAKLDRVKKQRNTFLWLLIAALAWIFRKPIGGLFSIIRKSIIRI